MSKERPKYSDKAVLRRAAEILFARADDYSIDLDGESDESVIASIESAIMFDSDGYARARRMEDSGWDPTAQIVEWLDQDTRYEALSEAVKAWVISEGITPQLPVGTSVVLDRHPRYTKTGDSPTVEGVITAVDHAKAEYTVRVTAYGHVSAGDGTYGTILSWESVESRQALDAVDPVEGSDHDLSTRDKEASV